MKQFEVKALGLEEMSLQEARVTDGGSITLLIVAAAALLLTGCTCTVVVKTGEGDVTVGDQKGSGTDVNADVGVNI